MKPYPPWPLLDLSTTPAGIQTGDAMVKQAPVSLLRTGTVHNGKYLILLAGSVAAVEVAYQTGLAQGGEQILDAILLPDAAPQISAALNGTRNPCGKEALGIIETFSTAAVLQAVDAAVKGADVQLVEMRLADDLGGQSIALYAGPVEEVETALEISRQVLAASEKHRCSRLIPRLDEAMARQIDRTTSFREANSDILEQGELP